METELNLKLQELCKNLGGAESVNYSCSTKIYAGNWTEGKGPEELLKEVMGTELSIKNLKASSLTLMLAVIRESFLYLGDPGSHPNTEYFSSAPFGRDLEGILTDFKSLFKDNSNVYSFYILEGHPFYPVFWEFAFLIKSTHKAYIVIGSSSD